MKADYDAKVHALYVQIHDGAPKGKLRTRCLDEDDSLLLDYDEGDDLRLYGIESLAPTKHLHGLAPVAAQLGFAALLDDIYRVMEMALGVSISPATLTGVRVSVPDSA